MTITVDVVTENTRTGTGSPTTFSHAAASSGVVGVVIGFMHGASSTNHFSSVTYGGVALTEIQTATDTATEPGFASLWFVGEGLSGVQGTQTVSYASGSTTDDIYCCVLTLKAAANVTSLQVASKGAVNNNTNGPSVALTNGSRTGMAFAAYYFGGAAPPTAGTNCTAVGSGATSLDGGSYCARVIRQTTGGTADFTIAGVGNDDTAFAAMMVVEAGPMLPAAGSGTFAGNAAEITRLANPGAGSGTFAGNTAYGYLSGAGGPGGLLLFALNLELPAGTVAPAAGSGSFAGNVPTVVVTENQWITPNAGAGTFTGNVPILNLIVPVGAGSGIFAGNTAEITRFANPSAGSGTFAGNAPTIAVTEHQWVSPGAGSGTFAGNTAEITRLANPGAGSGTFSGNAPVALSGDSKVAQPASGALTADGAAPTVVVTEHQWIDVGAGAGTFEGNAPTLAIGGGDVTVAPEAGTGSFAGYAPTVVVTTDTTEERPAGGYAAENIARLDRLERRRRKREADDLAEEIRRLEQHLVQARVLDTPAEPVDAARLRRMVAEYGGDRTLLARRAQRALEYAERARTELAYQLALREIQRQMEEEELALLMVLAAA